MEESEEGVSALTNNYLTRLVREALKRTFGKLTSVLAINGDHVIVGVIEEKYLKEEGRLRVAREKVGR